MEILPGEGLLKEKFQHSRKPSHSHVYGEFLNLKGQQPGGKTKNTEYVPNCNNKQRWKSGTDSPVHHQ